MPTSEIFGVGFPIFGFTQFSNIWNPNLLHHSWESRLRQYRNYERFHRRLSERDVERLNVAGLKTALVQSDVQNERFKKRYGDAPRTVREADEWDSGKIGGSRLKGAQKKLEKQVKEANGCERWSWKSGRNVNYTREFEHQTWLCATLPTVLCDCKKYFNRGHSEKVTF